MAPLSILIVGCGIAGPTLASFLLLSPLAAKEKPHITILERSPALRTQGQNVDIRGAGMTIIRKLGLESTIRTCLTGEEGAQIVDAQNRVWAEFGVDKTGKVQTGTSDIEILRGRLAEICYKRSKSVSEQVVRQGGAGVEYVYGDYLETIDQDGQKVHVTFRNSGEKRSFDLLVGADGLQSRTRNMVWGAEGEDDRVRQLGLYIGFFSIPSAATDNEWRRWFHAPGRKGIMLRPSEVKDRRTVSMGVINEEDTRFKEAAADGRRGMAFQKALLREYFQNEGWECERLLREMDATSDFYYDMVAQVRMDKWSKGRVVLLGDAAYCASPISGMGTTLGLNGAYNLAGALLRHPEDLPAAFSEYEQAMRPTVDRAQKLAPGMPRLIHPETVWGMWVMRAILWTIWCSGLQLLMFKLAGPPANAVPVVEYGFRELQDTPIDLEK